VARLNAEHWLRQNAGLLQPIYEKFPPPVQNLLTTARGWVLTRHRYNTDTYSLRNALREHESWSAERMREYQRDGLHSSLEYARRNVPYYRDYPPLERNDVESSLSCLPVLQRAEVRSHADAFISSEVRPEDIIRVSTTGTTGASLTVAYTRALMGSAWAFRLRHWSWFGVQPGQNRRITFFGSRVAPPGRTKPPFWTYNLAERQILMSIFHLSEATAEDYIAFLIRNSGAVVEGFPSVLGILAEFFLERGKTIPMRAVFTDGEPLYGFVRARIEAAFQTKVYDLYGNTELCGLMHECELGNMHLIPEWGYVEILDKDNRPVPPGEEGYLVWTSLVNRVMPLIRYRIGDRGCWVLRECGCGRPFPLIHPTITRDSDLLRGSNGLIFSPRALNQLLKGLATLRFCQFVQDHPGQVTVRGVGSGHSAAEELNTVCARLRHVLGDGMRINVELAAEPILRPGGKMPLILQRAGTVLERTAA